MSKANEQEVQIEDRRFKRVGKGLYVYAGREGAPEDSAGVVGWEFGEQELEGIRQTAEAGGHPFMDGAIGEELDRVVAAANDIGRQMLAERRGGE